MKLRLKRGICWLLVLSAVVVLVSMAQVMVLPALVRRVILSRLNELGLPHAELKVRSCSWRSAELAHLCLDEQRCVSVDTIAVQFSLLSLLRGEVKRVHVAGGGLLVRVRDGRLDLGELARLTLGQRDAPLKLPFERIDLRACALTVDWNRQQTRFPCEGFIRRDSAGRAVHDLTLTLENTPAHVHATLETRRPSVAFSIDANEVSTRALASILPGRRLWLAREAAEPVDLHVCGTILPQDKVTLSGRARGETFRITRLEASLPLGTARRADENARLAQLSWEAEGRLPPALSDALTPRGWDISQLGTIRTSGRLSGDLSNRPNEGWPDCQLPELNVVLSPGRLRVGRGVTLDGLSGILKFSGHSKERKGEIVLRPGSALACRTARIANLTTDVVTITFVPDPNRTAAQFALGTGTVLKRLRLEANGSATTVRTGTNGPQAWIGPLRLAVEADFNDAAPRFHTQAATNRLNLDVPAPALHLGLKNLVLEAKYEPQADAPALLESTLACDHLAVQDAQSRVLLALGPEKLAPARASFDPQSQQGRLQWQPPVQPEAPLYVEGAWDWSGPQPAGTLAVLCRRVRLKEEQAAATAIAELLGTAVSGEFSLDARWDFRRGQITPRVKIGATNATLAAARHPTRAEGVDGEMILTGFSPVSTPGNQRFHVDRLRVGRLRLDDGYVTLRWENDPAAVLIEKMDWGFLGGRVHAAAVRIAPDASRIHGRLFADRLNVTHVLGLLFGERAAGMGSVYGMIPLSVARDDPTDVRLGPGYLYSTTSGGWWRLQHDGATRTLRTLLSGQLQRLSTASGEEVSADTLANGLIDFRYSLFRIDFRETPDGLLARVTLRGRSRNPQVPVQFEEIMLDFPGFDENLRKLLALRERAGRPAEEWPENAEK